MAVALCPQRSQELSEHVWQSSGTLVAWGATSSLVEHARHVYLLMIKVYN